MRILALVFLFVFNNSTAQVAVDGLFSDWKSGDFMIADEGDHPSLDITKLWVSNDDDNLYIRIDTDREFDLLDTEDISIFIDADNEASTGFSISELGSEISFYFGNRQGFLNYSSDSLSTNHATIGMIALPTITSSSFEISFKRNPTSSLGDIVMADTISVLVQNGSNGDAVPNESGGIQYIMQDKEAFQAPSTFEKGEADHTRVMSYNILRDGFEDSVQKTHLKDVISAINPDIIAFQEIYDTPLTLIQDFLNETLPNASGKSWEHAKEGPDVVVFTRGIMEAHNEIDGNGVFYIFDEAGENPLIIYNVHLPCCDNDLDRQAEIDRIMSVVRDKADAPEINFSYPENTPFLITGDFNLVGESQNYKTLIEGDINNEGIYGNDFAPDWNGSNLIDANPYVTGFPSNYTWRNDNSSYNPGKLDFMIYSGSAMTKQNGFVLATEFLSDEALGALNLSANSTALASDHLPVVVDFTFGVADNDMDGFTSDVDCNDMNPDINPDAIEIANNDIDEDCDGADLISAAEDFSISTLKIYPNPVSDYLIIESEGVVNYMLAIYKADGRLVKQVEVREPILSIAVDSFDEGLYFIRLVDAQMNFHIRSFVKI